MSALSLLLVSVLSLGGLADDPDAADPGDPLAQVQVQADQESPVGDVQLASVDADAGTHGVAASSCLVEACVGVNERSDDPQPASSASTGGDGAKSVPERTRDAAGSVPEPVWYTTAAALFVAAALRLKAWALLSPRVGAWLLRGASAAAVLPLFSRIHKDKLLENTTRAAAFDFIESNPGATPQQLREAIGVAWGTAVYHLDRLERAGKLVSQSHGNRHRYYTVGAVPRQDRAAHGVLQSVATRKVAEAVLKAPGSVQKDLCSVLGIKNPAASKQLKRLQDEGLVDVKVQQRFRAYEPTPRLQQLMAA